MIANNCLLYYTLDKIKPLSTPKVNMWSIEDNYAYMPFLRFRFKDMDFEDILYVKLAKVIRSFEGNIKWDIIADKEKSSNYFILPAAIKNYVFTLGLYREKLLSVFNESEYKFLVDMSIKDIPPFVLYIERTMLEK